MPAAAATTSPLPRATGHAPLLLAACGATLLGSLLAARLLSPRFAIGATAGVGDVVGFVTLLCLAGLAWLPLLNVIPSLAATKRSLGAIAVFGFALRLLFIGSTPIYEDDWQRYLWDGGTLSEGISPYAYAPAQSAPYNILGEARPPSTDPKLAALQELAKKYPENHHRINYPHLSTIYPPLAQIGFWLANLIEPFSLDAWRSITILADVATFLLLVATLRAYGLSPHWSLLFWWNPLAIYATVNAAHMDALLLPPLIGALLLAKAGRHGWSGLALALAVGVKLWPLMLLPLFLAKHCGDRRRLLALACAAATLSLLVLSPMLLTLDPAHSGLFAYAQSWERNAFLFPWLAQAMEVLGLDGATWARRIVAGAVAVLCLWQSYGLSRAYDRLPQALLGVVAALFFLSPTGYPWYAVWIVAFLPFAPIPWLALLSATLPLYYARYALDAADLAWVNQAILIPIQFGLPLALGLWTFARHRSKA